MFIFLKNIRKEKKLQRGFVLLFGVTLSAILVMIAASMFQLVDREITLASTATESYFALYAADTGMDCVLYEEFVDVPMGGDISDVNCLGGSLTKTTQSGSYAPGDPYVVSIDFASLLGGDQTGCSIVGVTQGDMRDPNPYNGISDDLVSGTRIVSQGYNVCLNGSPNLESPTVIERRFEAWFPSIK